VEPMRISRERRREEVVSVTTARLTRAIE
jgi:hypothetical protein